MSGIHYNGRNTPQRNKPGRPPPCYPPTPSSLNTERAIRMAVRVLK